MVVQLCEKRTDVASLVEVAKRMSMEPNTVETDGRNVYRKLGLHSDRELMHFVLSDR